MHRSCHANTPPPSASMGMGVNDGCTMELGKEGGKEGRKEGRKGVTCRCNGGDLLL